MEVLTPEVGRNVAELIRQVKAFQHVRATGEVTPRGGSRQPTLKPGPDLAERSESVETGPGILGLEKNQKLKVRSWQ